MRRWRGRYLLGVDRCERGVFSLWFGLWRMDQAALESAMPAFGNVLPHEYVLPDLVRATERRKLFVELLERLLGSVGGELPRFAMGLAPDRAERTLAAAEAIIDDDERVYFRRRIALARGELDDARSLLLEAAEGDGAFRERAFRQSMEAR